MIDTDNAYNPMTEKTARAYMALGKLESIIYTESTPKEDIKLSLYRSRTVFDALITMSQFTLNKADIIDAHSALVEGIRIALPPKPVPTMADIEWDDNKHFLAEAEHSECGKVIMLDGDHQYTFVIDTHNNATNTLYVDSEDLTPTGRRYTISD